MMADNILPWPVNDGPRPDPITIPVAPDEERPVMVDDWLVIMIDDLHDTGEVIAQARSFAEARKKADDAPQPAESRRWIAVATIAFMQTRDPGSIRPTRIWSRSVRPSTPAPARGAQPISAAELSLHRFCALSAVCLGVVAIASVLLTGN